MHLAVGVADRVGRVIADARGAGLVPQEGRVVAAALFPVCFGLSAIAVPAVSLVYGTRWEHLGETMRWLAIFPGLIYLWTLNADAYRAVGKPHVWTQVASLNLLVLLPLLALAAPLGLRTFVAARFVGASLYPLVNIVVGGRVLQLSAAEQIGPVVGPLLPALLMYALVTALVAGFSPFEGITGWLKLSALVAAGAGSYIGILSWREPELWRSVRASTLRIAARA